MPPPDPAAVETSAGPRPGQFTAMISSTALDLPAHRALAHKACLEAGVFPIGMEQLPARDATGVEASLEMVNQADIYIGVYAFRYGWTPDGEDISITEMEFDRALARKAEGRLREILVFTAHAEHAFTAGDIEADRAAQEKLSRFKARAAGGRVRREFKSPEELHRLVLQALNEFRNRLRAADGAAHHTSVPNNLPRLQPFNGIFISYRRDEASAYAGRLYDRLAARFGREQIFLDTENVGWGEDFVEVITEAAESCAVMIVLVSRQWARGPGAHAESGDYVRLEVAKALGRKIRVIPILIQGASLPTAPELPEDLSPLLRRNALALSDARWERDVEDLTKTLEGLLKD